MPRCRDYHIVVLYVAGTDMLFLDRFATSKEDQSTHVAAEGMSFREFDAYEASNPI
jgi:hypothetical protein